MAGGKSPRRTLPALAERVVDAYGGAGAWQTAREVSATVSASGPAFSLKGFSPLRNARLVVGVSRPWARIEPIDRKGNAGVLEGLDVRLESGSGRTLAARTDARKYFPGVRRRIWWDTLDQIYFAGAAFWNVLAFPALLLREDVAWEQVGEDRLEARFPTHLPTHCAVQRFFVDPKSGRLARHDFTADVFGFWARVVDAVVEHRESGGIAFASRRRATLRLPGGEPAPAPVLADVTIHDLELIG